MRSHELIEDVSKSGHSSANSSVMVQSFLSRRSSRKSRKSYAALSFPVPEYLQVASDSSVSVCEFVCSVSLIFVLSIVIYSVHEVCA